MVTHLALQVFIALGVEINTVRLLASSGETIMRYVADAPLKTLRTDLGLPAFGIRNVTFCFSFKHHATSDATTNGNAGGGRSTS